MRRPLRSWLAAALAAALLALSCTTATAPLPAALAPSGPAPATLAADRFQIVHTNDIHGRLESTTIGSGASRFEQGGLAALAGMVRDLRARAPERTLLLDGGDAWQGTFTSNDNRGAAVTKVMSLMRYDAQALGNHDFDWGQDVLAQRAKEAAFPFLAANVVDGSGKIPAYAKPYIVKDVGLAKVGIIGLTNPRSATIVKASSVAGLRFLPAAETVRKYLPELQREATVVVVLSHIGIDEDTELAQQVPGIDLIVGGHTHLPLRTARAVGATRIFQAGAYTENLGRIEVTVDRSTKKVSAVTGADVLLAVAAGSAKPDPEIERIVAERAAEGKKITSRVVGRSLVPLSQDREMNNPLGNLIADALLDYGRQQGWKSDLAFYNSAGVRAPLPSGEITFGQLYQVLPFGNTVLSVDLTGEQLRTVFEGMAGAAGRLFMSGGTLAYRFGSTAGGAVLAATVGGAPLDPKRVYHVVTIDYLLTGGDGHTGFKDGVNVTAGDLEVDIVAAYFTAKSPLNPTSPGRVVQQ